MTPEGKPRRKRALARAQPGQREDQESLQDEIRALRELLHMVFAKVDSGQALEVQVKALDSAGQACIRLARLVKAQQELGGDESLLDELLQMGEEIRREMMEPAE